MRILKNIFILPLVLIGDLKRSQRSAGGKAGFFLLSLFFFLLWYRAGYRIWTFGRSLLFDLGVTDQLIKVDVRGDSMLPTIVSGSQVNLNSPKKYPPERGDIVSFQNLETGGLHYLKRIVGLPNENFSIQNGYVTINGMVLEEDYALNNLPTYGNTFLTECESYLIPENHFLVLGDNRTVSSDSRVIGFIHRKDIDGVIKTNFAASFTALVSRKAPLKTKVEQELFVRKINDLRQKNGAAFLMASSLLEQTAQARAESIRDNYDYWKTEATAIDEVLTQKGYRYNLAHEFITFGFLDEEGIIQQISDSSLEKSAFLSNDYLEVGIASAEKKNKECTFPIIVIVLGWPTEPSYNQETLDYWKAEEEGIKEALNFLQSLVGYSGVDQANLREIINLAAEAAVIAGQIHRQTENKEWIDYQLLNRYQTISEELETKLKALNAQL